MSQLKTTLTLLSLSFVVATLSSQSQAQTSGVPIVTSESISGPISNSIQVKPFNIRSIESKLTTPPAPTLVELEAQRDYELAQHARVARRSAEIQEAQEKLRKELERKQEPLKIELEPVVEGQESEKDSMQDSMQERDELLDVDDLPDVDDMLDDDTDDMLDDEQDAAPQRPVFGPWPRKGIRAISIDIRETNPNSPEDVSGQLVNASKSNWSQFAPAPKVYAWAAPDIRYQPLYFEDVALERYGQTAWPYAQSLSSGYHFWKSFWLIPHQMRHDHPGGCDHPLGFSRPGNAAPFTIQRHYFGAPSRRR